MITLYGIKNCDTIKKARKWLESYNIEYQFHDYRVEGISLALLNKWIDKLGVTPLLNKRGSTWRALPQEVKDRLTDEKARDIMLENPGIIKRPVLDNGKTLLVGFSEKEYSMTVLG